MKEDFLKGRMPNSKAFINGFGIDVEANSINNPHFTDVSTWPNDSYLLPQTDITVVIGTYNRAHLLLRSLFHYQHCQRPKIFEGQLAHDFPDTIDMPTSLVIMDDGSTDFTRELCEKFANERLPIYYFYLGDKEPGTWRDSAAFINKGLSFAIHALGSQFVFPTHPEICVGETTISDSVEWLKANRNGFALARGYYLTPEQQEYFGRNKEWFDLWVKHCNANPDSPFDGRIFENGFDILSFIKENPDFYNYGDPTHPYHHCQVERTPVWESWIFAGANRETWLEFGGFGESNAWGTIDVNFRDRRNKGGFVTWTPQAKTAFVTHENHDDPNQNVVTPRDMELCLETAGKLGIEPRQPGLLDFKRWIE